MKLTVKHHHHFIKLPQGKAYTEGYFSEILASHLTQKNYNFQQNYQE